MNEIKNKWYHFGRWVEPVLSAGSWLELNNTKAFRLTGIDFIKEARDLNCSYYFLKRDLDKFSDFVEKKIRKDIAWFDGFFAICEEQIKNVSSFEGKNDLENFLEAMIEAANCTMAIELLDYGLERYLEKLLQKTKVGVSDVLNKIKPDKKTLLMQYQDDLKTLREEDMENFVKKWQWVGTHFFMGNPLTEEKLKKEISATKKEKEAKLSENILLPEDCKTAVEIGSKMAFYRSYIVETIDKIAFGYWSILKKLGEKNNLNWQDILYLTYKEIIQLKREGTLPDNFEERRNGFGIVMEDNKTRVIVGKELKKQLKECQEKVDKGITEFKGMVACRSDKKIKGIVKIVEESKHISKMNKGDILVANETTPDYVIGMKIAGAIITNQGGLTSHAAIISRELSIPCIIGTKIATKVLKDRQLVEVDTNKGIVRILKK